MIALILMAASPIVPAYIAAQSDQIVHSAERHTIPSSWLAAVLYNEMLGTEDRLLHRLIPGQDAISSTVRQGLLGLHLLTVKQLHWGVKTAVALLGGDPTLGPAGIRVSVGREIRREMSLEGGVYQPQGWAERFSMILDLLNAGASVEYLAANLQRGQERLAGQDRGKWAASARWHNTGVVYDSAIVRRPDWEKGSRYINQVEGYLPQVAPLLAASLPAGQGDDLRPPPAQHIQLGLLRRGERASIELP